MRSAAAPNASTEVNREESRLLRGGARPSRNDEIEALVQRARRLPCPHRGSTAATLNAATVGTVRSFLIASFFERDLVGAPVVHSGCRREGRHRHGRFGLAGSPIRPSA